MARRNNLIHEMVGYLHVYLGSVKDILCYLNNIS
jgi:hypothetical protein